MKQLFSLIALLIFVMSIAAQRRPTPPASAEIFGLINQVSVLTIRFEPGRTHNHPLMVFWLADDHGNYIQTLYVAESIGRGYFRRVDRSSGRWLAGAIQRPAALPFWAHQRGIKNEYGTYNPTPKNAIADAYTGATPPGAFVFHLVTEKLLKGTYNVFMEINQSWDWNNFWHNNRFPDDPEYKTSSQPAVVYKASIDTNHPGVEIALKPIGRSHHSGKDGILYTDLNTLTTALNIVKSCTVTLRP